MEPLLGERPKARCAAWRENLQKNRSKALDVAGPELVEHYERYLDICVRGWQLGTTELLADRHAAHRQAPTLIPPGGEKRFPPPGRSLRYGVEQGVVPAQARPEGPGSKRWS